MSRLTSSKRSKRPCTPPTSGRTQPALSASVRSPYLWVLPARRGDLRPALLGHVPQPGQLPRGQKVRQHIARLQRTAIGALAPDFTLPDPSDKFVKLANLRGQYVLIDFWVSWCVSCWAENSNVAKAYAAYDEKNFTVVSISLDNALGRAAWLKAIEGDGLPWPQVSGIQVDPQGHIVAKNLKGALPKKLA
jgi:thiol-disulfide isomerase/thioredoxin